MSTAPAFVVTERSKRQAEWVLAAQRGDKKAAALAIGDVNKLIWKLARRCQRGASRVGIFLNEEDVEDMHAEAQVCLLKSAIPRFNPANGGWLTYSLQWIRAACSRWVGDHGRIVRIPINLQSRPGREKALAAEQKTPEGRQGQRVVRYGARSISVDADLACHGADGGVQTLLDLLADPSPTAEDRLAGDWEGENLMRLLAAVTRLPPRLRSIIEQRSVGKTLEEIGVPLLLSRERVRQLQNQAIDRLRVAVANGASREIQTAEPRAWKTLVADRRMAILRYLAGCNGRTTRSEIAEGIGSEVQNLTNTIHPLLAMNQITMFAGKYKITSAGRAEIRRMDGPGEWKKKAKEGGRA